MQFQASKHLKLLLFFILLLHFQSSITAEDPTFTICGSSNYTSGSQYETNLNAILLPNLSSNGVIKHDRFYNNSYGYDVNKVYGYSQCRSAASEDDCRQCLTNSTAEIIRRCPNKTQATIRYYNCILRYSNQCFFYEVDTTIRISLYPVQDVPNVTLFNTQASGLLYDLATAAASAASKYAVNLTKYNSFGRIYGLAQCTRDLSESNCDNCLRRMIEYIPTCCDGRTGGNVYSVSCNIRYDMYKFFSLPPPGPPPPPVAADSPTPTPGSPTIDPTQGTGDSETRYEEETEITLPESFLFNLNVLRAATNNFSTDNKLGEGGFGPVYKGKLSDGREIAVKRLSKRSRQGLEELRNEVALVAKLQHRNLVRLWGWCIEEQEKMLVYEYVANNSLDKFLFVDTWHRNTLFMGNFQSNETYLASAFWF